MFMRFSLERMQIQDPSYVRRSRVMPSVMQAQLVFLWLVWHNHSGSAGLMEISGSEENTKLEIM